jgi:hypothetical protein
MRYSTYEKLARKLRGRLHLGEEVIENSEINSPINALYAYKPAASDTAVDLRLIDDIAEQQEDFIDLVLSQLYQVPLKLTSNVTRSIVGSIAENFILAALLAVSFQGTSTIIQAADSSSASMDFKREAEFKLMMLTAGENIWFPSSIQAPQTMQNVPSQQALVLPGEIRLSQSQRPDLISRNYTVTVGRRINPNYRYFEDMDCKVRKDGTALSSDPTGYCIYDNEYKGFESF